MGISADCALDVRINQENYTRGIAIHVPSENPAFVASVVGPLLSQIVPFVRLDIGGGEVVIGQSPDVRIGAHFRTHLIFARCGKVFARAVRMR